MTAILVSAPTVPLLSLAEAKRHLRVEHDEDDELIAAQVAAVAGQLDPAFSGWLGRALRPQTWRLDLLGFPRGEIVLPYPPLVSISSIFYTAPDGTEQTLAAGTGYRIVDSDSRGKAMLAPPYGKSWPSVRTDYGAVRITFEAGYAVTSDGEAETDTLPPAIKAWAKLAVATLYDRRETVVSGQVSALPAKVDGMILPYRVW
ncbi:hypothetical protein A33M_1708 [Rhodovulum sp. PH10]|uniref:head-tail connector protein n=1 Tax=Rhodovulum sp. PH10 TaxID=1187851 RepID=UPI00027C24B0|nr:hypothetical protein [Rhodovulum sp. PH10]EJW12738.1 hypothetical protein A33M_1708 [Rhodovulum sp. PH10]